jgi:hypothetical protein
MRKVLRTLVFVNQLVPSKRDIERHGRDGLIYWAGTADMPDGVGGPWESAPQSAR